jgi:hypothetical protein
MNKIETAMDSRSFPRTSKTSPHLWTPRHAFHGRQKHTGQVFNGVDLEPLGGGARAGLHFDKTASCRGRAPLGVTHFPSLRGGA